VVVVVAVAIVVAELAVGKKAPTSGGGGF